MMSNEQEIIYIILSGVIGIFVGFCLCYLTMKRKSTSKLEDELTKNKRELAHQRRILTEFFSGANALYEQLDISYHAYTKYMADQTKKIYPNYNSAFENNYKSTRINISDVNNEDVEDSEEKIKNSTL